MRADSFKARTRVEAWRFSATNKDSSALAPTRPDRYCTVNCTVLLRDAAPDVAFTVIV
jgi:hypothetical protein